MGTRSRRRRRRVTIEPVLRDRHRAASRARLGSAEGALQADRSQPGQRAHARSRSRPRTPTASASFALPSRAIAIEPGNAIECPFTCFPPQADLARTHARAAVPGHRRADRRRAAGAAAGAECGLPPAAVAAVVAGDRRPDPASPCVVLIISLLPKQTVVPNLTKAREARSQPRSCSTTAGSSSRPADQDGRRRDQAAGRDRRPDPAGRVPRPSSGTLVTVAVYAGTGMAAVPSVVGHDAGAGRPGAARLAADARRGQPAAAQPDRQDRHRRSRWPGPRSPTGTAGRGVPGAARGRRREAASRGAGGSMSGASGAAAAGAADAGGRALAAAVAAQAGKGPITIPAVSGDPTAAAGRLSQLGLVPRADQAARHGAGRPARRDDAGRRLEGRQGRPGRPADLERIAAALLRRRPGDSA